MPTSDRWSQWLAETRFGGDSKTADMLLRVLTQVRDHLLKKAMSRWKWELERRDGGPPRAILVESR